MSECILNAVVVLGLRWGDEAKGKIVDYLIAGGKDGNDGVDDSPIPTELMDKIQVDYDLCVRFQGGCNAGHTVYVQNPQLKSTNIKIVLHGMPTGILSGIPSLIGSGCVIDPVKLEAEIKYLESKGFNIRSKLMISGKAHLITELHKKKDAEKEADGSGIGSTKSGIAYCYADKALRTGIQVQNSAKLYDYYNLLDNTFLGCEVIDDDYRFIKSQLKIGTDQHKTDYNVMMEGAQGYELGPNGDFYPYVTSNDCGLTEALKSLPDPLYTKITVIGSAKAYDTYVGTMDFGDPDDPYLPKIQQVGKEEGATTGRKRGCDWLRIDRLVEAIDRNSVHWLIINKCDILADDEVNQFKYWVGHGTPNQKLVEFPEYSHLKTVDEKNAFLEKQLRTVIYEKLEYSHFTDLHITFSYSPRKI